MMKPTLNLIKIICVIVFIIHSSLAIATTIIVNEQCTVNDALKASQLDIRIGECEAGSGIDTIILPPNGTYLVPIQRNTDNSHHQNDGDSSVKSTVITRG